MSTNEPNEIYTNTANSKNILTHSKEGNTSGKNTAKTINDLIKQLNKEQKKESE